MKTFRLTFSLSLWILICCVNSFAQTCSGTTSLTATSGIFDDGSGGASYSNNLSCNWLISPLTSSIISLQFTAMSLESCCDYVRVYDGPGTGSPVLGTFSGTSIPSVITSSGNSLFIVFFTNGSITADGWSASYTSCPVLSPPVISTNGPAILCQNQSVTLSSSSPTNNLWSTGETSQSIVVNTPGSYTVASISGQCTYTSLPVVISNQAPVINASSNSLTACAGGNVTLSGTTIILEENFDPITASQWTLTGAGAASTCGSVSGSNALYFAGSGTRNAVTNSINTVSGGTITFYLKRGTTSDGCNVPESADNMVLEYSVNGGVNYSVINTYTIADGYTVFTPVAATIPVAAQSTGTRFRWRQTSNSGANTDIWALDNVVINSTGGINYLWSPTTGLSSATISNPVATIQSDIMYTVQISNAFCTSVDSVHISLVSPPQTVITADGPVAFCLGNSVSLSASAGVSYQWSTGSTAPSISVSQSDNFSVTVNYGYGCSSTSAPLAVTANPLPIASITATDTTTCHQSLVTLSAYQSIGYSYQWIYNGVNIPGATGESYITSAGGNYLLRVIDGNNCIDTSAVRTITDITPNIGLTAASQLVCANGTTQLNASLLYESFDPIVSYQWTLAGASTASTCGSVSGNALYFNGSGTRSAATSPINTSGGGTISYYLKRGTTTDGCNVPESSDNMILEYSVNNGVNYTTLSTHTIADGFTNFTLVNITIPVAAQTTGTRFRWRQSANSGSNSDIWAVDNIFFELPQSTASYLWTPSTGLSSATVSNPVATITDPVTYTVELSNGTCTATKSISINLTSPPVTAVTADGPLTFCSGDAVVFSAPAGVSYLWSTGENTQSITAEQSNSYSVTVDYGFGCVSSSPVQVVTVNNLPPVFISIPGATGICNNSSVVLNGNSGVGYSYQWQRYGSDINGATQISYTATLPGNYSLEITDQNNCTSISAPSTVSILDPQVVLTANPSAICQGGSVQLAALASSTFADDFDPINSAQWVISGGSASNTCGSVSGNALYFNGSSTRTARTIPVSVVAGGTVSFSLKIASGEAPCEDADPGEEIVLEYSINNGNSYVTMNTYGTTSYINFTTINENIPVAAMTATTIFRWRQLSFSGAGNDHWVIDNVSITGLNSTNNYTYQWSPSASLSSSFISNPVATISASTTYSVIVTNSNCSTTEQITVPVGVPQQATISGTPSLCSGGFTTLTANPGQSYLWSNGQNTQIISITQPGSYWVTVNYGNGCSSTSAITNVSLDATPTAIISLLGNSVICDNSPVILSASFVTGYSYQWLRNNSIVPGSSSTYSAFTPGSYTVIVTGPTGCYSESSPFVVVDNTPSFNPTANPATICSAGSTQLNANGIFGYNYSWFPSTGLSSTSIGTPVCTVNQTTTYTVTATNNGCTVSKYVTVNINEMNVIATVTDASCSSCCNGQIITSVIGGATPFQYIWTPSPPNGQGAVHALNVCPGDYVITVQDNIGCSGVATAHVSYPNDIIDEAGSEISFSVMPNPASSSLTVTKENIGQRFTMTVLNSLGETIMRDFFSNAETRKVYDINNWSSGIYFVQMRDETGISEMIRLVKE